MVVAAIIACEIGFWVVLGAGLLTRCLLRRRRLSSALLLAVPLVDVALLVLTVIDLRRGAPPAPAHSLAAIYLGFTVAFGHSIVRWADARFAHRSAGGPAPRGSAPSGTEARMREEWRAWGLAVVGAGVAAGVMLGLVALTPGDNRWRLLGPLPGLGLALAIWLVGWPGAETFRVRTRRAAADGETR